MIIRKTTTEAIEEAARTARVEIRNLRPKGRGFRFTLGLLDVNGQPGEKHWRRLNHTLDRRVGSVCWHGHREFMRELYKLTPDAVIITAFARYEGTAHFEAVHGETYYHQIGSQVSPCYMGQACECVKVDCEKCNGTGYKMLSKYYGLAPDCPACNGTGNQL